MKQFVYLLAISIALLFTAGCGKSPQEKIASYYEEAIERLSKFDYNGAQEELDKISKIDPSHAYIPAIRGRIAEQHLWTLDAYIAYAALMEAIPTSPEGFRGAYRVQKRLGAFADALVTADALGKILPRDTVVISTLCEAVMQAGLIHLASRLVDSAVSVGVGKQETDLLRARAQFLIGETEAAHTLAGGALPGPNASARVYELAADYYETIGFFDSAMIFSAKEMEAAGSDDFGWLHHFDRALRTGYFAVARDVQRQVIAMGADSSAILGMQADYLNATDRFVEASNRSYQLSDHTPRICFMRMLHELRARSGMDDQGMVSDNLFAITSMLNDSLLTPTAHQFIGNYLYTQFLEESINMDALNFVEYIYGPPASRVKPRVLRTWIYDATGHSKQSDSMMSLLEVTASSQPDWQTAFGDMYSKAPDHHFEKAKAYYEKALTLNPNYKPAFDGYLSMLEKTARYAEGETLMSRFPHFSDRYPDIVLRHANQLLLLGKHTEAVALFESALAKRSGDMRAINGFFDALSRRCDIATRERAFDFLAHYAPENPDILALVAEHTIDKGQIDAAGDLVDQGIKKDPDLIPLYALKAKVQYAQGKTEQALQFLDSVYTLYPYDPDFIYQYSRLLTENKVNFDKAANLARGSVMHSNYQMAKYQQMLKTYYEMGRFDLSWAEASNLMVSYPHRPEGFFRMGLAGVRLGKPDSKEYLERSIALGLGCEDLQTAQKALAEIR